MQFHLLITVKGVSTAQMGSSEKKEGILINVLNFSLLFIYKEMDSDFK